MRMHKTNLLLMHGHKHLLAFLEAPQEQLEHLLRICSPSRKSRITDIRNPLVDMYSLKFWLQIVE